MASISSKSLAYAYIKAVFIYCGHVCLMCFNFLLKGKTMTKKSLWLHIITVLLMPVHYLLLVTTPARWGRAFFMAIAILPMLIYGSILYSDLPRQWYQEHFVAPVDYTVKTDKNLLDWKGTVVDGNRGIKQFEGKTLKELSFRDYIRVEMLKSPSTFYKTVSDTGDALSDIGLKHVDYKVEDYQAYIDSNEHRFYSREVGMDLMLLETDGKGDIVDYTIFLSYEQGSYVIAQYESLLHFGFVDMMKKNDYASDTMMVQDSLNQSIYEVVFSIYKTKETLSLRQYVSGDRSLSGMSHRSGDSAMMYFLDMFVDARKVKTIDDVQISTPTLTVSRSESGVVLSYSDMDRNHRNRDLVETKKILFRIMTEGYDAFFSFFVVISLLVMVQVALEKSVTRRLAKHVTEDQDQRAIYYLCTGMVIMVAFFVGEYMVLVDFIP
jgi:hypothetical protein